MGAPGDVSEVLSAHVRKRRIAEPVAEDGSSTRNSLQIFKRFYFFDHRLAIPCLFPNEFQNPSACSIHVSSSRALLEITR